jgi:hypothetical protein
VRALTDVELIVFAGNELQYLLLDTQISKRVQHLVQIEGLRLERLLISNSTLYALTRAQKLHLESLTEVVQYRAGEYVWRMQDEATFCVIVHTGSLSFEGRNKVMTPRAPGPPAHGRHPVL